MKPLITIVTITYNVIDGGRKSLIEKCFNSIYKQSISSFEHLIIDGASNDGTQALLQKIAHKSKSRVISEPDAGVYNAMNKGISLAKGKYISFLNTDDYYHNPNGLEEVIKQMDRNGSDLIYSDVRAIDSSTNRYDGLWKANLDRLVFGTHFCHQGTVARTTTLKNYLFDEDLRISADSDQLNRMVANGESIEYSNTCFASYRSGGLSNLNPKLNRLEHSKSFFRFLGKKEGLTEKDCYNLWNFSIFFENKHKDAIKYYQRIPNTKWQLEFLKQHAEMIISGQIQTLDSRASNLVLTNIEVKIISILRRTKHLLIPKGSSRFNLIRTLKKRILGLMS